MRGSSRMMGTAVAICAALLVTATVTSVEALSCSVERVRITTRTLNYEGAECDDDGSTVRFYFGNGTNWFTYFNLDNWGVLDFKEGAIDEFERSFSSPRPSYPDDFKMLRLSNIETPTDVWGLAGFRVEIRCEGSSEWYPIYTNRGTNLNLVVDIDPTTPHSYTTSVGNAGLDSYNGDHEVFWLMNIGDHLADGIPDDLANCNSNSPGVDCRVRAVLENSSDYSLMTVPLTDSWWDVGNAIFINPLEKAYGECSGNPLVCSTGNIWRWFWTSGSFTHSQVAEAKLVLDHCSVLSGCTMQLSYLHSTVMQAWGKPTYEPYPYFRSHIYEADLSNQDAGGWLTVTGYYDTDFAVTNNVRYYGFGGAHWHVESAQDSEHSSQQMDTGCGYKSLDMIVATRGYSYEEIPYVLGEWGDPAFDEAETWEEASAIAHLVWGYKTMCCGTPFCCDDAQNCDSNLDGLGHCSSANYTSWWRSDRCSAANYCFGNAGDVDGDGYDNFHNPLPPGTPTANAGYFWRDTKAIYWDQSTGQYVYDYNGVIDEEERFPHLIDYDGLVHIECRNGINDDGDAQTDERDEFWTIDTSEPPSEWGRCMRGATDPVLKKFLMELASGSVVEGPSPFSGPCNLNPTSDLWFGGTTSVVDALSNGLGMYFGWGHKIHSCDTSGHYSVIDGYERIFHPGPPPSYDYLFFIGDPNSPESSQAGWDYGYEGMDNLGFSMDDFTNTVTGVAIWDYDFYN